VITAIPGCVPADEQPIYEPTTVAQHIAAKLAGSRSGTLNTGAERDAARVRAASPY
jgi:hypothetical protein